MSEDVEASVIVTDRYKGRAIVEYRVHEDSDRCLHIEAIIHNAAGRIRLAQKAWRTMVFDEGKVFTPDDAWGRIKHNAWRDLSLGVAEKVMAK